MGVANGTERGRAARRRPRFPIRLGQHHGPPRSRLLGRPSAFAEVDRRRRQVLLAWTDLQAMGEGSVSLDDWRGVRRNGGSHPERQAVQPASRSTDPLLHTYAAEESRKEI